MPDKDPHKKTMVSAGLIRQYLAGELDDKAMHALERQALDDPFLADALEGYARHAPEQQVHQDDLAARLTARVAPRKAMVRPMYYRRAAAAAALLLLIMGGWFLLNEQTKKAPIAKMDIPPSALQDTAASPVLAEHAAAPAANTVTPATPEKASHPAIAARKAQRTVTAPAAPLAEATVDEVAPAADKMREPTTERPAPAIVSANRMSMKKFSNDSNVAAPSERETVAFSGRADKAMMMKEDGQKDEERVSPVGGFIAFEKYLHDHTINPDNKFTGTIRVSFTVMPDSSLQDLKVIRGLNAACDAEAIRVIKEGPVWKPATDGKPAKATVNVLFKVKED